MGFGSFNPFKAAKKAVSSVGKSIKNAVTNPGDVLKSLASPQGIAMAAFSIGLPMLGGPVLGNIAGQVAGRGRLLATLSKGLKYANYARTAYNIASGGKKPPSFPAPDTGPIINTGFMGRTNIFNMIRKDEGQTQGGRFPGKSPDIPWDKAKKVLTFGEKILDTYLRYRQKKRAEGSRTDTRKLDTQLPTAKAHISERHYSSRMSDPGLDKLFPGEMLFIPALNLKDNGIYNAYDIQNTLIADERRMHRNLSFPSS